MAGIPRKLQKVFGSALVPDGNVAVYGSLQAGAPAFSDDPDDIQSLANFLSGFNGCVVGNRSQPIEDMNGLMLLVTRQLAYLLTRGVPEWQTDTEYNTADFARVGTEVYVSLTDANVGNDPTTDTDNWKPYRDTIAPAKSVAKAWVNFDGTNGTILAAYNVASVVRTAAGSYLLTFENAMADADYAVVGSCGPANGGARNNPAGNNNHVSRDTVTTTTQVSVWVPKPDLLIGEDAGIVSVQIFGN